MSIENFYALYTMWASGASIPLQEVAKCRTFRSIYDARWKHILKMREIKQHARHCKVSNNSVYVGLCCKLCICLSRCTQCAEFTARMRRVTLQTERSQLEKAQSEHIKNVAQYRAIQSRLASLSEAATSSSGVDLQASVLKLDIDGLDQAKTRYPRNLASSKSLSHLWRPQVHMIGVICWGAACLYSHGFGSAFLLHHGPHTVTPKVVECYYILAPDEKKDSSTEATCILKALDATVEILNNRQIKLPEHLIIEVLGTPLTKLVHVALLGCGSCLIPKPTPATLQSDNCCREGKNQVIMKLSASSIISRKLPCPERSTIAVAYKLLLYVRHAPSVLIFHACTLRFRSVTHIFGEVGHTHGPLDQRLGIAVSAFTESDTIQAPEDCAAHNCFRLPQQLQLFSLVNRTSCR